MKPKLCYNYGEGLLSCRFSNKKKNPVKLLKLIWIFFFFYENINLKDGKGMCADFKEVIRYLIIS